MGDIQESEKSPLLHLEDTLHENVRGQNEAIRMIAKTMRRIRTGVARSDKPMGTFLFLGPTGSGKTETAKTLAQVFFGSEDAMSRLDMGEYSTPQSVLHLLGDDHEEGYLEKVIHMRPYGVLLLDEFEKSSQEIQDFFLRILDEGVYTNGRGARISLKTQIIIATSNAGTDILIESGLTGEENIHTIESIKTQIVDAIVINHTLKPELINRFDATILFAPLSKTVASGVAYKMLSELASRMYEKGYTITWDESVVEYLITTPEVARFGGRAIQRTIQDVIEDVISKKIITGDLSVGGECGITAADLQ